MKKSIIWVVAFVGLTALLSAKGCGIQNASIFKSIACPPVKDKESTVVNVDFSRDMYSCKYTDRASNVFIKENRLNCRDIHSAQSKDITPVDGELSSKMEKFFQRGGRKVPKEAIKQALETSTTESMITSLNNKRSNNLEKIDATFKKMLRDHPIDSHTDYRHTLSAVLGATFTLNPSYFEKGFVNEAGEIQLKKEAGNYNLYIKEENGIINSVLSFFGFSSGGEYTTTSIGLLDFIDKVTLGYLVQFAEALRKVYFKVVTYFFLLGALYSFSYYGYKKAFEKYGKEKFETNKISFITTMILSSMFFAAPVFHDGKINDTSYFIGGQDDRIENWSSIAQEAIRFTVDNSNYFANMTSDFVMQIYLGYVAKKQGFLNINKASVEKMKEEYTHEKIQKAQFLSSVNFYENVCRKYYKKSDNENFILAGQNTAKNEAMIPPKGAQKVLERSEITADRLDGNMCVSLENKIIKNFYNLSARIGATRTNAETISSLYNVEGDSAKAYEAFVKIMAFGGSKYGWLFSTSIPSSYFYFKNSDLFMYDRIKDKDGKPKSMNTLLAREGKINYDEDEASEDDYTDEERGAILKGLGLLSEGGYWFVVPGFSKLYETLNSTFQKMYISNVDVVDAIKESKRDPGRIREMFSSLKGVVGGMAAKIPGFGRLISMFMSAGSKSENKYSKTVQTILGLLAFLLAIVIISYAISAIAITVLSFALTIRALLVFIEILYFFMAVPIIGIYYTIIKGQGQAKNHLGQFFLNLSLLFVSPIVIVFTSGLLIPITEIFNKLFSFIMNMISIIIDKGGSAMVATAEHSSATVDASWWDKVMGLFGAGDAAYRFDWFDAMQAEIHKAAILSNMQGLTMVFTHFATLIIGLIMILYAKSWLMKLAGVDSHNDMFKDSFSEARQGTAGRIMNPVG